MESQGDSSKRRLENELIQGRDYARQLQAQLNDPSTSSQEMQEILIQKIIDSFARAISIMTNSDLPINGATLHGTDAPIMSEDYDCDFKEQDRNNSSGKRKNFPRWTQNVQACTTKGLEGPPEDGYNWRKYGQKDIHHARFPRGYYRCTLQKSQGCQAKKQTQRTDDDPSIFQVTYCGNHTCSQNSAQAILRPPPLVPPASSSSSSSSSSRHQGLLKDHKPEEIIWSFQSQTTTSNQLHDHQLPTPPGANYLTNYQPSSNFTFPSSSTTNAVVSSFDQQPPCPLPDSTNYLMRAFSWPPDQVILGHEFNQLNVQTQGHDNVNGAISSSPADAATDHYNTQDFVPDFPDGRSEDLVAALWPFGN